MHLVFTKIVHSKKRSKDSRLLHVDPEIIPDPSYMGEDMPRLSEHKRKEILQQLRGVMTPTQYQYMIEYFINGKNIPTIAREYGVYKSTVSRTLRRAIENARKLMII